MVFERNANVGTQSIFYRSFYLQTTKDAWPPFILGVQGATLKKLLIRRIAPNLAVQNLDFFGFQRAHVAQSAMRGTVSHIPKFAVAAKSSSTGGAVNGHSLQSV
ncbi:hypothetical protein [Phaeobacter inhibens]|uniref:hypothetical protein n=1 Tax=Phaeobacter inhibens TaxID=221822 RepID=UPI0011E4CCFB|nr:hypothetical protein [Phaeobacter inhibens]